MWPGWFQPWYLLHFLHGAVTSEATSKHEIHQKVDMQQVEDRPKGTRHDSCAVRKWWGLRCYEIPRLTKKLVYSNQNFTYQWLMDLFIRPLEMSSAALVSWRAVWVRGWMISGGWRQGGRGRGGGGGAARCQCRRDRFCISRLQKRALFEWITNLEVEYGLGIYILRSTCDLFNFWPNCFEFQTWIIFTYWSLICFAKLISGINQWSL